MGDVALSVLVSRSETAAASRKRSRGEPEPRFHVIASRTDNATSPKCPGLPVRYTFSSWIRSIISWAEWTPSFW